MIFIDFRFSRKHRKRWWKTHGGRKMIYFHAFFSHIELVVDSMGESSKWGIFQSMELKENPENGHL